MLLLPIDAPPQNALAIRNPEQGLHGYEELLEQTRVLWRSHAKRAREEGDLALSDLSSGILELFALDIERQCPGCSNERREYGRRAILGALAVATFLTEQWGAAPHPGDALEAGNAVSMVDFCGQANLLEADNEFRIHSIPQEAQGEHTTTWYQTESLYLRRVTPPQLSLALRTMIAQYDVQVNYSRLETFYPYLPSQEAAKNSSST